MRLSWVLGACGCVGCAHVSTSDYGVAAGFAVAAGALQAAEVANQGPTRAPPTAVRSTAVRSTGSPASPASPAWSPSPTSPAWAPSPLGGGSVTAPQVSLAQCRQVLVFCFEGTYSVCMADASGCEVCSCSPYARLDTTFPQ
jgi:hypothetical protein